MERDLFDPVVQLDGIVGREEELGTVGCAQSEHVLALGVVVGSFALRLVEVERRGGRLALRKVLLVLEEAQQLPAKHCVKQ